MFRKCELKMVRVIEVVEEEESDVEDDEDTKMDDTAIGHWFRFSFLYLNFIDYFLIHSVDYAVHYL